MDSKEAKQMIQRCINEIEQLRGEIGRLRPMADAYQLITKILGLVPGPSVGYGEDLVWILKKRLREIEEPANAA